MALQDDYLASLFSLLPRGLAWRREPNSPLGLLLAAFAEGLARAHERMLDLIEEWDPRTTSEMLPDWESALALTPTDEMTDAERREVVVLKVTAEGGQSEAYFEGLADELGHEIAITTYRPMTCGSPCDGLLYDEAWAFAWRVDAPDEAEASGQLAAVLHDLKPGHTSLFIAYGS